MKTYICYYCDCEYDIYTELIDHLVETHASRCLKYRELELDPTSGDAGYRSKTFNNIIPQEGEVFVSSDHRVGLFKKDRSKKSKLNTPSKLPQLSKPGEFDIEESTTGDQQSVCDLISEMEIGSPINDHESDLDELVNCLPAVIENLRESGNLESYKRWCNLLAKRKFPMQNICFQLFLDVVDWFSNESTSSMRYYRPETRRFWEVGYRLFKEKFVRFMAGPKSHGQIVEGTQIKGACSSSDSQINFAVPSLQVLCKDKLEPIMPGIMTESISAFASYTKSHFVKIGIDGKKIARGKGKIAGDIDCWGFEPTPTLRDRNERYLIEAKEINDLTTFVRSFDDNGLSLIPHYGTEPLCEKLNFTIPLIGKRMKDLRETLLKYNFGIEKFIKLGVSQHKDWKKSKYAPIISSLKVAKYDIEQSISTGLQLVNEICHACATLNYKLNCYSYTGTVDMDKQRESNLNVRVDVYLIRKSQPMVRGE